MYPKIIGIVGPIRAGKSRASAYLQEKYGYEAASNSDVLREIAHNLDMQPSRENLRKVGDAIFRALGDDAIARFRLNQTHIRPIVVDGIRYLRELSTYSSEPTFKLLGLTASEDVRYSRAVALAHEGKDQELDRSLFGSLSLARSEVQVAELLKRAHVLIENEQDLSNLEAQLDLAMKSWDA